jgi:pimeloyl-ACP methyl ester carboxylesterase
VIVVRRGVRKDAASSYGKRLSMRRGLTLLALALSFFVCSGAADSAGASEGELAPYLQPQRLVDVGGHKLNIYCTGQGSPTVILDAGGGESAVTWRKIQPAIAKSTRVCSYDRASMGFSGDGPLPRDGNAMVSDLHALLHNAQIAPPYVLVGHSSGGLYAQDYAGRYLQDVAGMVLVDPSFPNQTQALQAASPALKRMDAQGGAEYTVCYEAALHGELNFSHASEKYALCGYPPNVEADLKAGCAKNGAAWCKLQHLTLERTLRPAFWLASGSEETESTRIDPAAAAKERSYGAMPLVVLTAADEMLGSPFPPAENRALDLAWAAGHERIARLSSAGVHTVVPHSGHFIQLDQPAVVIDAINNVITAIRAKATPSP